MSSPIQSLQVQLPIQERVALLWSNALIGLLALVGFAHIQQVPAALPATQPAAKVYTLGNDNIENLAKSPTTEQIKVALASLDGDKVNAVYLKTDDTHAIQANWEAAGKISFQYTDGGDEHMFMTRKKNYPPEIALKLFLSYMSGADAWLKMVDWAPLK